MTKRNNDPRIELHAGDITRLEVEAIVNAANRALAPGGGVCGAVHRAAGPELAQECAGLGGCPTGEARITKGYRLPAKHVIHTVGPVWHGGQEDESVLLAACYSNSLDLARDHGLSSIAFPAISTGIYGFPLEQATGIAVATVRDWLAAEPSFGKVVFAVFGSEAEVAYRNALAG